MKQSIRLCILVFSMALTLTTAAFAANADQVTTEEIVQTEGAKDIYDYLWPLTGDEPDEEFALYLERNCKILTSMEPLFDPVTYKKVFNAKVHFGQGREDAKEEYINALEALIQLDACADRIIPVWDKDNMATLDGEEFSEEELDASTVDGYGFVPFLISYLLDDPAQAKGNMIIVSGGTRTNDTEGYPAAERFCELGYNTFILQRRVGPYSREDMGMDVQRSVRIIRQLAAKENWGGQDMIAVCGFSAGGMATIQAFESLYGSLTPADVYDSDYIPDEIDAINSDMDAALLIYTGPGTLIAETNPHFPAMYMCVGTDDQLGAYDNLHVLYDQVVEDELAPVMIRDIEGAGHGFGVGQEGARKSVPECAEWPAQADEFIDGFHGYAANASDH